MLKQAQTKLDIIEKKLVSITSLFEIKNPLLKKILPVVLFMTILHIFYSYVGIYDRIYERPCSIHSSAQCQRASVALNYYAIDMNFFEPRIQRFNNDDGITGLEFPVIYYTAAVLYKIFGFNDYYLRIISLLIISAGLIFFYLLTKRFVKNAILSIIVVSSVILSPVLMFYSANFMPDAPSLGLTLISWYFFFKFTDSNQKRHLNFFVFFGTLAALIKAVSAMGLIIVACLVILDWFKKFKNQQGEVVFKRENGVIIRILIGLSVVVAWYLYAKRLSEYHGNQSFAMTPMMIENMEGLRYVMKYLRNWIFQYYSYETYVLLSCAAIFIIIAFRKINKLLLTITVLYGLASICYIYLFFYQFAHHDYYFIALLPFTFFLVLTFTEGLARFFAKYSRVVMMIFSIIIIFNIRECLWDCKVNYFFRFDSREYLGGDYRPYYDLEPKLRALGMTRNDKVVSAFDDSYSNSLYFMNQPGFTVESVYQHDTILHALNAPGVKYLVVNDSAKFNKQYGSDLSDKIVVTHRGLIVYKLK